MRIQSAAKPRYPPLREHIKRRGLGITSGPDTVEASVPRTHRGHRNRTKPPDWEMVDAPNHKYRGESFLSRLFSRSPEKQFSFSLSHTDHAHSISTITPRAAPRLVLGEGFIVMECLTSCV
jgi:hypothetical protein